MHGRSAIEETRGMTDGASRPPAEGRPRAGVVAPRGRRAALLAPLAALPASPTQAQPARAPSGTLAAAEPLGADGGALARQGALTLQSGAWRATTHGELAAAPGVLVRGPRRIEVPCFPGIELGAFDMDGAEDFALADLSFALGRRCAPARIAGDAAAFLRREQRRQPGAALRIELGDERGPGQGGDPRLDARAHRVAVLIRRQGRTLQAARPGRLPPRATVSATP
jgi:hypothetical protein